MPSRPEKEGETTAERQAAAAGTVVYNVSGMTCGHCEKAVSEEVSAITGVTSAHADAASGTVTVKATAPLDDEAVRTAVDEAGYQLAGRA